MKSPCGARFSSGLYCSGLGLGPLGTPSTDGSSAEGMVVGMLALFGSIGRGRLCEGEGPGQDRRCGFGE